MSWSWKLGTFRGIEVYVHATFVLLLAWIMASHLLAGHPVRTAVMGALFMALLFLCVVLHEFGHALTAQRFGVRTRDITLYPIGGVARLERIPRNPVQELWIALAGPAVNVVIAAGLYGVLLAAREWMDLTQMELVGGNVMAKLMWINLGLALFNLLPAFPMDGGRVLRAVLATRLEYGRATHVAATIGQGMAFLFGFIGLMSNPFLLFIAFFVFMGAAQEAATVDAELAFRGVSVRRAMMTEFETLQPADPLAHATERLLASAQQDYPVVQEGEVIGMLTRSALVDALARHGLEGSVSEAMGPAPAAAAPGESLEAVFQRMREETAQSVPVVEEGRLVGLLTLENIGELLLIRNAIQTHSPRIMNRRTRASV